MKGISPMNDSKDNNNLPDRNIVQIQQALTDALFLLGAATAADSRDSSTKDKAQQRFADSFMNDSALVKALADFIGEAAEPENPYVAIQEHFLAAIDENGGVLPADFELPVHLQEFFDNSPGLQQFASDLQREGEDELTERLAYLSEVFEGRSFQRLYDNAIDRTATTLEDIQTAPAFALRGEAVRGMTENDDIEEIPGDQQTSPIIWHDEDETIFVTETWVFAGDEQYTVRLQASTDRDGKHLLSRDEWRPLAHLGDRTIRVFPDPGNAHTWVIDSMFSREELGLLQYGDAE